MSKSERSGTLTMDAGFDRCILCVENEADSYEHLIPYSIGGRLAPRLLCRFCNSWLGANLVPQVKEDLRIRYAVRNLKNIIPHIFDRVEGRQKSVVPLSGGEAVDLVYHRDGGPKIYAKSYPSTGTVFDWRDAPQHVPRILEKKGWSKEEVDALLDEVGDLPDEPTLLQVTDDLAIGKLESWSWHPAMGEKPFFDDRVMAATAFAFLSLRAGDLVYHKRLDPVREYIKSGRKTSAVTIDRFMTRQYDPWHKIYIELREGAVRVVVILFRQIGYKVDFSGFCLSGNDHVIVEDMKRSKTLFALTVRDAENGEFCEY